MYVYVCMCDTYSSFRLQAIATIASLARRFGAVFLVSLRSADWSEGGMNHVAHIVGCVLSVHPRAQSAEKTEAAGADPDKCIGFVSVRRAPVVVGSARLVSSPLLAIHRRRRRLYADKLQPPPIPGVDGKSESKKASKDNKKTMCSSALDF